MSRTLHSFTLLGLGFIAGALLTVSRPGSATGDIPNADISHRTFMVSIDEVRQNFVFGEKFSGSYKHSVTMSDGSVRNIELVPLIKDGRELVEFRDNGGHTFMGVNGTTTNGTLMVNLKDFDQLERQSHASK